jgi:flagellar basal body-associated protein FliL
MRIVINSIVLVVLTVLTIVLYIVMTQNPSDADVDVWAESVEKICEEDTSDKFTANALKWMATCTISSSIYYGLLL